MQILLLNPIPLHVVWPIPTDFVKFLTYNPPSTTFPQLAAAVPGHTCEVLDGLVGRPSVRHLRRALRGKDLVAITVPSNLVSLNAELNMRLIRRLRPGIKIVMGGIHPSIYHRSWVERGADFVIRRDGELTFAELARALERGAPVDDVAGLTHRRDGKVIVNPDRPLLQDLDALPMPRWEVLDLDRYRNLYGPGRVATLETSRGCVASCDFCMASEVWDHSQRFKSPGRVLAEARRLRELGVTRVWLTDDNFGEDPERDGELCRRLAEEDLGLRWSCFTRADNVLRRPDFYRLAARAGLESVMVGYETLSMASLGSFNKGYRDEAVSSLDDYRRVYDTLRGEGVFTVGLFVIGHPEEDPASSRQTLSHNAEVCDFPFFTPFRPETPRYTGGEAEEVAADPRHFYFNTLALYEPKPYQRARIAATLATFARPRNMARAVAGDPFSRGFYRGLYLGILLGVSNFHRRMPRDLLEMVRSPDGISSERFERYAGQLIETIT